MATSREYIDFVLEQLHGFGALREKKMFGEYMVYLNDRPILTVCDNTVFVKDHPQTDALMQGAQRGYPYQGARACWILDIENRMLLEQLIPVLAEVTPLPKPRKKKA